MNNDSVVMRNSSGIRTLNDDEEQDNRINVQTQPFSLDPIINTDGFTATTSAPCGLNGNSVVLSNDNVIRLTDLQSNGTGFSLPANGLLPHDAGLTNYDSVANINPLQMGLINVNNLGLVAVPTFQQPVMKSSAPLYERVNPVPSQLNFTPESSTQTSRELSSNSINSYYRRVSGEKVPRNTEHSSEDQTPIQIETSSRLYRDYSKVSNNSSTSESVASDEKKSTGVGNFPVKLHEILARDDIIDIVSWSPHGRSWKVHKPKVFEEEIIPKYFRHSKYNSFTRQVNGWGFRRITQGADHNAYYHEFFLRGVPYLCKRMRRLNAAVYGKSDICSRAEPDFYRIGEISPLPEISEATSDSMSTSQKSPQDEHGLPEGEGRINRTSPISSNNETVIAPFTHQHVQNFIGQQILNQPITQIGYNLQQQFYQPQLVPQFRTSPILALDPNNMHQSVLVQQALFNGLSNPYIGGTASNFGFGHIGISPTQVISPQIAAAQGSNGDSPRRGDLSNISFPFY